MAAVGNTVNPPLGSLDVVFHSKPLKCCLESPRGRVHQSLLGERGPPGWGSFQSGQDALGVCESVMESIRQIVIPSGNIVSPPCSIENELIINTFSE